MKYTGTFKDINDKQYTINITTNNDSTSTKTVTWGTSPIVTEIETSESHLYKPCKYSSATIKLINDDYSFDLYSSTAQQNKVELIDSNGLIRWIGYTTPNLYNMGYENEVEEIEIEAIDALSTLQYYQYRTLSGTKEIVSIIDIIDMLINKCNAYTNYYISNNIQYSSTANNCLSTKLYISEQNFFDEDDEPMTLDEVLEEICKFLNVTCVADGTNVYFLDYDAIINNINTYYKFTVGNTTPTLVTLEQSHAIEGGDYVLNGGTISLDNVYNKVAVKDSLYSFDSVIPSLWDEKDLTLYLKFDITKNWHYYEQIDEDGKGGKHKCFFKYYSNKNYKSYYYNKTDLSPVSFIPMINYGATQLYVGASICKACFKKVDSFDDAVSDVSYTDYLLLHTHNTNNTKVTYADGMDAINGGGDDGDGIFDNVKLEDDNGLPLFQLEVNNANPSFVGGKNVYLLIQGTYIYMDRENKMYIPQGYTNKDDNFNPSNLWIKAKLQFGDKYWNGDSWQTTECCFKLPFDNNNQTEHCINQSFPTKNTVTYEMGVDAEGYCIPMPSDDVMTGKPTFTLYTPHKIDPYYRCDAVWLSNFDVKAKVANFDNVDNDSDTEYSNVIDSDFVNDMDDVEFRICTWDNKECNYSAIAYYDGSKYSYLDNIYNKATKQNLRSEEHFIYKLVTQYSTPSVILNLNLKNNIKLYATLTDKWLPNKLFIVDSITTDWEYNTAEIKLIEKK